MPPPQASQREAVAMLPWHTAFLLSCLDVPGSFFSCLMDIMLALIDVRVPIASLWKFGGDGRWAPKTACHGPILVRSWSP